MLWRLRLFSSGLSRVQKAFCYMVFPGTSFVLGASDIHQRSNISSMRSFESRWGSKKDYV